MTPVCKFCGQVFIVTEEMNKKNATEYGTMHCHCTEAVTYQENKKAAERAKLELRGVLDDIDRAHNIEVCNADVVKMLEGAIDIMAENNVEKIVISISNGGTISINRIPGKISVQRSVTLKSKG